MEIEEMQENLPSLKDAKEIDAFLHEDKSFVEKVKKIENMDFSVFNLPLQYENYEQYAVEQLEHAMEFLTLGLTAKTEINEYYEKYQKEIDVYGRYEKMLNEANRSIDNLCLAYATLKKALVLQQALVSKFSQYTKSAKLTNAQQILKTFGRLEEEFITMKKLISEIKG